MYTKEETLKYFKMNGSGKINKNKYFSKISPTNMKTIFGD